MSMGATDTEPQVLVAVREASKAIASARDAMTFETNPQVLGQAACDIVGLTNEVDALRIGLMVQAKANGVPQDVGLRTMGQFVAAHTTYAAIDTNRDSLLGDWLGEYPVFAEAFANAEMTVTHLNYLRLKIDNADTCLLLRAEQDRFADASRDCSFDGFKKVCDYWLVLIDPDGKEPIDQIESTKLSMRKGRGGRLEFSGSTDAVSGHALQTMVEHEAKKMRAEDLEAGIERTATQRNYAALHRLALRGFARSDGTLPVPLINAVMSLKVAEWAADQLENPGAGSVPVDPFDIDGRCELIDGTPVHPLLVAAVAGLHLFDRSTLRRYVLEADSRILDYSVNARTAPEYMRTASHVEHRGGCGTLGCDAPHTWLESDHVDPHSNGGPTSLINIQPQCPSDNGAKGAITGLMAWKDRPPIKRMWRSQRRRSASPESDDGDSDRDSNSATDD
jgi:hypothetical protein